MNKKILMTLLAITSIGLANSKITNIEVTNLSQLSEDVIKNALPIKEGNEYTNKVSNDIYLSLLRTGLVQNVNIYPTKDGDNVNLKIVVDELPNAKAIYENKLEIEALKEKTEYLVNKVYFTGTDQNLNALVEKSGLKIGEYFSPYDAEVLKSLIMSTGYFGNVELDVHRSADDKSVDLEFKVVQNPVIKSVKITGSKLMDEETLIKVSRLKVGEILNLQLLRQETSPLLKAYADNGYVWVGYKKLDISNDGDINIEISEAKVSKIVYDKKGTVKDGERIDSKDYKLKTNDFVLKRNTYIKEGDVLNQKALETTLAELFRTGLFSNINHEITQDINNPENLIVRIVLTERPTTAINANISYSTEDSLSGSLKLSDSNFLGREESFDLTGEAGIKGNYSISLGFKDPWIQNTSRILAGGNIYFKKTTTRVKDLDEFKKDPNQDEAKFAESIYNEPTDKQYVFGINGQIGKGLTSDIYLTLTPRLINVYSKSRAKEEKARVYQDYTLASIGGDLIYDTRDDRNTPKKGLYADLYVEGGYIFREKSLKLNKGRPIEITDKDGKGTGEYEKYKPRAYALTTLDLRAYHPVYKSSNSMAYRLLATYAHDNTPVGQLAVVGDGITLRGLPNSVSSNKYSVTFTAENRTYFNDYLQGVLFYDAGIAENIKIEGTNKLKFVNNIGLGARINTPIGVVRLDYAWNLEKGKKPTGKFNFGFGQTF
ncbi:BamA/OMP85 family outer membrane protein [Pseudostreptobacillus sp.]